MHKKSFAFLSGALPFFILSLNLFSHVPTHFQENPQKHNMT